MKTKKTTKTKEFSDKFLHAMSPIKSLPNATCSDKNCQCYRLHHRQTGEEGGENANIRNTIAFKMKPIIRHSSNHLEPLSTKTHHSHITKEKTKNHDDSDKSDLSLDNSQWKKNYGEVEYGVHNNAVTKNTCDIEAKKPSRKTLSLSAWAKIHEAEKIAFEQKISDDHSELCNGIKKENPTTINVKNDEVSKLRESFAKTFLEQNKTSSNFEVQSSLKTAKIENQTLTITSAKKSQQNVSVKLEPINSITNDPRPLQQISFIRNDIGVPVLFSPQRLTVSPSQSREATETSKCSESSNFPQPIYSTYGTIPSPSKTLNSFYVLPYLIVPAKTFAAFSSQDSRNDSERRPGQRPVYDNAPLNKSTNCTTFNQKSWSGVKNMDTLVQEGILPIDNDLPIRTKEMKKTKKPKKCISKNSVHRCKNAREINKMKFALSLELMKKEKVVVNETVTDNIIESTKTGRITFVPAAQIRTTEADTCYTLQVVSVIKTQLESECRHTLGWTPAAINRTAEGHINMVFAPRVCKGLYLIEDMIQKKEGAQASGRQDVRLIPFAPFLELPKTCLALALGNQETTWGACVDFLKQLKPFSLVHEVVSCIMEGRDCVCSNVSLKQKTPECLLGKKKSKFVSLTMPSCHCCQCQPNHSRKKAKGNK